MSDKVVLAFSTFPDVETARRVAREIVEQRLAACGNILPQIHSVYRWQDKVESGDEALAIFKLSASRYAEFERKLRSLHPYDETALREVAEETGIRARLLRPLGILEFPGKKEPIRTKFYLMELIFEGEAVEQPARQIGWFSFDEAQGNAFHPQTRKLLLIAEQRVRERLTESTASKP
jgi:periplasmic divalent cation tolerance protein